MCPTQSWKVPWNFWRILSSSSLARSTTWTSNGGNCKMQPVPIERPSMAKWKSTSRITLRGVSWRQFEHATRDSVSNFWKVTKFEPVSERACVCVSSRAYVFHHCFRLSLPCLHSTCYFIDCWASPSRGAYVSSSCPGLTASRAAQGGFFLSSLMRRTNLSEMLLLMGFRSKFLKGRSKLGDKAFGHAIGNSIAVGVLARILKNAMWALGWRW